ncbi:Glycosyltransferase involved in cell wall bisynthesis [Rhizobiales bacterium GAS113]|nr:Glycosyltransferase involved in cell wall bisynthesis [Rhizobiales bacterium GAS113]
MGIEIGMPRPIRRAMAFGLRLAPIAQRRACVKVVSLVAPRIAARLASVLEVHGSPWPSSFAALPLRPDAVAVWGYLRSEIGLGTAARGALEALRLTGRAAAGMDVPLPDRANVDYPVDAPSFRPGTNLAFINPPEILTGEAFFPHRALRGTRRIAHWAWELSHLPRAWLPAVDRFDELWAGSNFVAQAIAETTARKVEILPYVVSERELTPRAMARAAALGLPDEAFVFLCAFDFASHPARKNPTGAIRAFVDAFPATDPDGPWLIVKSHGAATTDVVGARIMEACGGHPRVRAIHAVLSTQEMALLQDACDCIVSLHHSEGFGLNIAECMLAGKAAIATGYSGNMDFMDAANSYPVGYKLVDVRDAEYPHHQGQVWAEPDRDDAVELMRHVASRREEAQGRGAAARATILARFTAAAVARDWTRLLG